jgi:hypothetical protein
MRMALLSPFWVLTRTICEVVGPVPIGAVPGMNFISRLPTLALCGGGLMVGLKDGLKPTAEDPNGTLKRFAIAGSDKKWFWADARIDGNEVVVSSPEVPKPVAVRYAFSMNPEGCNLYNKDGLPASPFRTDSW